MEALIVLIKAPISLEDSIGPPYDYTDPSIELTSAGL